MKRPFRVLRALLFFLLAYVGIGGVWYFVEEGVSPLAASAVSLGLTLPIYWLGSAWCLGDGARAGSAALLGCLWCACALVVDVILWVEPLGILSEPLNVRFSAETFYMERYYPYLLLTYAAMVLIPVVRTISRRSQPAGSPPGES